MERNGKKMGEGERRQDRITENKTRGEEGKQRESGEGDGKRGEIKKMEVVREELRKGGDRKKQCVKIEWKTEKENEKEETRLRRRRTKM